MKILNQQPPNFSEIKQYFGVEKWKPVFWRILLGIKSIKDEITGRIKERIK